MKWIFDIEEKIVSSLSRVSQSVHWASFWIVYFIVWMVVRYSNISWYSEKLDLTLTIVCTAIIPFWIENSLKHQQGRQIEQQEEQMKLLTELVKLNLEISNKMITSLDEISEELESHE